MAELAHRRRSLYEPAELSTWREELTSIETRLVTGASTRRASELKPVRASEVLASLTDGEMIELRLVQGGRRCEARTRLGGVIEQQELSDQQLRCVVASLRLALADTLAMAGIEAPLVWDEPFSRLDDRSSANLATAIDDYRRRGRQALIFTGAGVAIDRFRSLGVEIRTLRGGVPSAPISSPTEVRSREVVRREESPYVLDIDDPIERFPAPIEGREVAFRRAGSSPSATSSPRILARSPTRWGCPTCLRSLSRSGRLTRLSSASSQD